MADKEPSQLDIIKAQMQDLAGTANQMFGAGREDYRAFQNTQNVLGGSSPQDVIRQDFGTLKQQSKENVPSGLTPQEQNLYAHHLNNLTHGGFVMQGGDVSTVYNTTTEQDGKTYLIPTVWNGQIVSPGNAIERAKHIGLDQFPSYGSEREASARYDQLHKRMEQDVQPLLQIINYLKSKGMM
jgi:hypothetical protein